LARHAEGVTQRSSTHFVISANFTRSGGPAYLAADGEWSTDLQRALALPTKTDCDGWLARAEGEQRCVADPYCFEVKVDDDVIHPLSVREQIRAHGPTTRLRRPD